MNLFVDTSAWLALYDSDDGHHKNAVKKSVDIRKRKIDLVTSDYILDESITIIRHTVSHKAAVAFGESIMNSGIVKIVRVTDETFFGSWEMFRQYDDKRFSFTDCTSFILMKMMGTRRAFTFDRHFRQAGFEIF